MSTRNWQNRKGGISIFVDIGALDEAHKFLTRFGKEAEGPIIRAVNRTIRGVATDTSRQVRNEYNVKAMAVKKAMSIRKARKTKKNYARLDGRIRFEGTNIPLYEFSPSPRKPSHANPPRIGVSVKVKHRSGRKKVPGTFIANMPVRGLGVYYRPGRSRNRVLKAYSVSVPKMMENQNIVDSVTEKAQERFEKNSEHEIDFFLRKKGLR